VFGVDLRKKQRLFSYTALSGWFLWQRFYPLKLIGYYIYHQVELPEILRSAHTVYYVFRVDLRKNSDYFPIQHYLAGFYDRDLTL
jgi:hypothetical protein